MGTLLLFSVLVGLDNLHVSSAIGLMEVRAVHKWTLALAFGLCEAAMPLIGLTLGHLMREVLGAVAVTIGPFALVACGLLMIYLALQEKDTLPVATSRWLLFGLPLTLSLDNLLAGIGLGALGYPVLVSALTIGLVSGSMCFLGLFIGQWIRRWIPCNLEVVSGAYLVLIAVVMFFFDLG